MKRYSKIGAIKWFDATKGFGVITSTNGEEFFLHENNFEGSTEDLKKGASVRFRPGKKKDRKSAPANNCSRVSLNDLESAIPLAKTNRSFTLEVTIRGKSRWGNPYVRKEDRSYDLLGLYFRSAIKNISFSEFLVKFLDACSDKISSWKIEHIADLINVLEDSFRSVEFVKESKKEKSNSDGDVSEFDLGDFDLGNFGLIDQVVKGVLKELSDQQKFQLWKLNKVTGLMDRESFYGLEEEVKDRDLPFSEAILVDNFSSLEPQDFKRLKKYSISSATTENMAELLQEIPLETEGKLKKELEFCDTLPEQMRKSFRKKTLSRISPKLYLLVWASSNYKIDIESSTIETTGWGYRNENNFLVGEQVVTQGVSSINKAIAQKLVSYGDDGVELLVKAWLSVQDTETLGEIDLNELIRSIQILPKDKQLVVVRHFAEIFDQKSWEFLLDQTAVDWDSKDGLLVLQAPVILEPSQKSILIDALVYSYNKEGLRKVIRDRNVKVLSNISPESYQTIFVRTTEDITNEEILTLIRSVQLNPDQLNHLVDKIDFSKESSCLRLLLLLNDRGYEKLTGLIEGKVDSILTYSGHTVSSICVLHPLEPMVDHLINECDYTDSFILETILTQCSDEDLIKVKDKVGKLELSFSEYNEIVKTFLRLEKKIFPIRFRTYLEKDFRREDLLQSMEICSKLPVDDQNELGTLYQEKQVFEVLWHDRDVTSFLKYSFTGGMQQSLMLSLESDSHFVHALTYLHENKDDNLLNDEHLRSVLEYGLLRDASVCFFYALNSGDQLIQFLCEKFIFTDKNYEEVFDIVERDFEKFKTSSSKLSDLGLLLGSLNAINEDEARAAYEKFNKSTRWSFQTILYMLVLKLQHNGRIAKWHEKVLIESNGLKQLGIKLIHQFLNSHTLKKEDVMKNLNITLKDHFKLLDVDSISSTEFSSLFSIRHLVKACDGRKSAYGLNHWKGGQFERYYSKGSHGVSTDSGSENMYCEGRLWKTLDIWSAETNKPTGKSQTLYWCKRSSCAEVNVKPDLELSVSKWTLSEIAKVKSLSVDRLFYTNVAGWLNRMKTIFDRLHCHDCKEILRPLAFVPNQLGFYAVPLFNCVNSACKSFERGIRFTHCRGCKKILDSRECETCDKCNWLECDDDSCGRCGCGSSHIGVYAKY